MVSLSRLRYWSYQGRTRPQLEALLDTWSKSLALSSLNPQCALRALDELQYPPPFPLVDTRRFFALHPALLRPLRPLLAVVDAAAVDRAVDDLQALEARRGCVQGFSVSVAPTH